MVPVSRLKYLLKKEGLGKFSSSAICPAGFVVCLMLLSGLFTPTRSMPSWAYATTYVNPMHYFIDAIRTVFVRGGTLSAILHQLLALTALSSLMGVWAVVSYKKNS